MKTLKELSELLVEERKKRGLSQKDMRMLIGMSQQQYQRVESGQDLKVSTLLRILVGLGLELSISDLTSIDSKRTTPTNAESENVWAGKHKHLED
ncbi:helix-turn-helix domain-containing protein [Pseudidiomarina salilacus]|uniref:helix-turn-helix domain-containing protein n=1 Tax=Pseudidiomarina salilacus TaxID=3384452 RepID=UPI0039852270